MDYPRLELSLNREDILLMISYLLTYLLTDRRTLLDVKSLSRLKKVTVRLDTQQFCEKAFLKLYL